MSHLQPRRCGEGGGGERGWRERGWKRERGEEREIESGGDT